MKKTVTFEKKLTFPTMIGEITAIDLEHNLRFVDKSNVEGDFFVKGKYKLTEASRLEEEFNYKIPTEITLSEKLDLETTKIEIVDFYYELENEETMVCHIELKIEGLEEIDLPEEVRNSDNLVIEKIDNGEKEERECDGEIKKEEEKEIPHKEEKKEIAKEEEKSTSEDQKEVPKEEIKEIKELKESDNLSRDEMVEEKNVSKIEEEEEIEKQESISSLFSSLSEKEETFASYSVYILREEETINTIIEKYKTTKEELEKYNDLSSLTIGTKIIIPTPTND